MVVFPYRRFLPRTDKEAFQKRLIRRRRARGLADLLKSQHIRLLFLELIQKPGKFLFVICFLQTVCIQC